MEKTFASSPTAQDTYRDGGLRLVDNVQVTVADREDRAGFVLTADEATLDAGKTAVELTGTVEMESSDGLSASTDNASYTERDGVVRMPGPTTFRRDGMDAAGDGAEYDRGEDVLRLLNDAHVDLISDTTRTRILSPGGDACADRPVYGVQRRRDHRHQHRANDGRPRPGRAPA